MLRRILLANAGHTVGPDGRGFQARAINGIENGRDYEIRGLELTRQGGGLYLDTISVRSRAPGGGVCISLGENPDDLEALAAQLLDAAREIRAGREVDHQVAAAETLEAALEEPDFLSAIRRVAGPGALTAGSKRMAGVESFHISVAFESLDGDCRFTIPTRAANEMSWAEAEEMGKIPIRVETRIGGGRRRQVTQSLSDPREILGFMTIGRLKSVPELPLPIACLPR